ncbi:MAG: MotA/TolQ/ExbB proton channel family protein, partial [Myxococcales bacterium]|nr:MotA/TolQ/ExbB proton channel family protein [Myxococcales bacterium]
MLGASWVMWLLIMLSVISLAIVLERTYYLLASRDDIQALKNDLLKFLRKGDIAGAKARLAESRSFEAKIVQAGMDAVEDGAESADNRMQSAAQLARLHMERNLAFLGTVGNNAPFAGLLGTVIGVIRSFQALNDSGGQVTSGLMAEIGEALVATAIGILVALPAVAFFNLFQRLIRARLARADALGK